MKCVKCGKEITKYDAYCNNCGTINLNCDKNKVLQDMLEDKNYQYEVNNLWHNKLSRFLDNSKQLFVLLNLISFIISFPVFKYVFDIGNRYNLLLLVFVLMLNFYRLCIQFILKKAKMHWWGMFIPGYDIYLMFKLSFGNGYLFILMLFPMMVFFVSVDLLSSAAGLGILVFVLEMGSLIIILIEMLVLLFMIGRRFGRSGIITVLFFYVIIPSIAFNKKYVYDDKYEY